MTAKEALLPNTGTGTVFFVGVEGDGPTAKRPDSEGFKGPPDGAQRAQGRLLKGASSRIVFCWRKPSGVALEEAPFSPPPPTGALQRDARFRRVGLGRAKPASLECPLVAPRPRVCARATASAFCGFSFWSGFYEMQRKVGAFERSGPFEKAAQPECPRS
ncbi:hypothetical protein M885DRAFT_289595 [Pelagophyceae sp. CCMP2097]|nr:hypothetical protein M885DRAFT_289595 [Pelagophyceae sp. CCMP2097]